MASRVYLSPHALDTMRATLDTPNALARGALLGYTHMDGDACTVIAATAWPSSTSHEDFDTPFRQWCRGATGHHADVLGVWSASTVPEGRAPVLVNAGVLALTPRDRERVGAWRVDLGRAPVMRFALVRTGEAA